SIRAAFDIDNMGEISVKIDADVIQADGGTRCASITGAFVATYDAIKKGVEDGIILKMPAFNVISAISVGIIDGVPMLDLPYNEDSQAEVDMNIISSEDGKFIEIQGTAEGKNFTRDELNKLLDLAIKGNTEIIGYIKKILNL
ncbi:MAG: ribonuclease PH, partial [Promethearchaeia archaeon]